MYIEREILQQLFTGFRDEDVAWTMEFKLSKLKEQGIPETIAVDLTSMISLL